MLLFFLGCNQPFSPNGRVKLPTMVVNGCGPDSASALLCQVVVFWRLELMCYWNSLLPGHSKLNDKDFLGSCWPHHNIWSLVCLCDLSWKDQAPNSKRSSESTHYSVRIVLTRGRNTEFLRWNWTRLIFTHSASELNPPTTTPIIVYFANFCLTQTKLVLLHCYLVHQNHFMRVRFID